MKSFSLYLLESEAIENTKKSEIDKALNIFTEALKAIKDDYSKCLAVMNFINNQDGSISEMILAELLNRYSSKINGILSAKQVGGSLSLTDIIIDIGKTKLNISLKTSKGNNTIKLGTDTNIKSDTQINSKMMYAVFEELHLLYLNGWNMEMSYDDMLNSDNNISENTKKTIKKRILSITKKICGPKADPEVFCWIEKITKKVNLNNEPTEILTSLLIKTYSFNAEEVEQYLMKCPIYLTNSSWGFENQHGDKLVLADNTMILNITKDFLQNVANDKDHFTLTKIYANDLPVKIFDLNDKKTISRLNSFKININNNFTDSLLNIYSSISKQ